MDEPTTHLDVGSIDALIGALGQYQGTLVFISHDVYFIRAIAKTVLHIDAGKLTPYAGDYGYYLDKTRATSARAALVSGQKLHNFQPPAPEIGIAAASRMGLRETREQRRVAADARKAEAKSKRELAKRVSELEMQILTLEGRQRELTAELEKPETYEPGGPAMQFNRELEAVTAELGRLTAEWEKLAERSSGVPDGIDDAEKSS
jgi:ATP-binding cassette subfamily F protein 3